MKLVNWKGVPMGVVKCISLFNRFCRIEYLHFVQEET